MDRYAGTPSASWPGTSTTLGAGTVGTGTATEAPADVVVGGPPITDSLVGGPPHEPGTPHRQTTTDARSSSDAGA